MNLLHYITFQKAVNDPNPEPVKRRIDVGGLPVSITHPRGSIRELKDGDGKTTYKKRMFGHYGEFDNTKGRDGDPVDVFVGPLKNVDDVYVIHMVDDSDVTGKNDEDKAFVGYPSADAAKQAFLLHYDAKMYDGMTILPFEKFKQKMSDASLPYRRKKITAGGPGSGRKPSVYDIQRYARNSLKIGEAVGNEHRGLGVHKTQAELDQHFKDKLGSTSLKPELQDKLREHFYVGYSGGRYGKWGRGRADYKIEQ